MASFKFLQSLRIPSALMILLGCGGQNPSFTEDRSSYQHGEAGEEDASGQPGDPDDHDNQGDGDNGGNGKNPTVTSPGTIGENPNGSPGENPVGGPGDQDPGAGTNPDPDDNLVPEIPEITENNRVPQFALLVNDSTCAFCHVKINGDVASTRDVPPIWQTSVLSVNGQWHAARGYFVDSTTHFSGGLPADHPLKSKSCMAPGQGGCILPEHFGTNVNAQILGIDQNLGTSQYLPNDLDNDGFADFPQLDYARVKSNVRGKLTTPAGIIITNVHAGNLALIGSESSPIVIDGEILVEGDLIIKGRYTGIGNIYATGNIYIPADLRAMNSAFPFSEDPEQAEKEAIDAIKAKKDALALATAKSILISDLEKHGPGNTSPYDPNHWAVPADRDMASLDVENVYSWYTKDAYDLLYEANVPGGLCNSYHAINNRTFNLVEAFLYAGNTIGGRANRNSYAINGGIIADHFHIISGSRDCTDPNHINPVHGLPMNFSYINFDFRMKAGLLLLKQLWPYFEKDRPAP